MKKRSFIFAMGIMLGIAALVISAFFASVPVEAKKKIVTTKNGTKLYCYSDKGKSYDIYKIKNVKKELIIPETVDGKHKIVGMYLDGYKPYKQVRRIHFPSGMKALGDFGDEDGFSYSAFYRFPNLTDVSVDKKNPYYSAKDGKVYYKKNQLAAIAPGNSNVTIESWVTSIWESALVDHTKVENFSVEEENPKFKSVDGVLYSKDGTKLISYPIAKKDEVFRVPDGVKTVGTVACFEQKNLKEIEMSSSVRKIEDFAFAWCPKLEKVSFNEELKILEEGAFCNKKWISLSLPAGIEEVEIGTLPVKELEIPAACKKVRLDVDMHSEQTWLKAKTLIVRSLSLDLIKMDRNYCNELEEGWFDEGSVYSGKTIYAYKSSKAYKQLSKIAKKFRIKLKVLSE